MSKIDMYALNAMSIGLLAANASERGLLNGPDISQTEITPTRIIIDLGDEVRGHSHSRARKIVEVGEPTLFTEQDRLRKEAAEAKRARKAAKRAHHD